MAKKTNRSKAKSAPRPNKVIAPPAESTAETAPAESAGPRAPRPPKLSRSQAASERLEDEYSFISGDLWRVFILAAAMFALLIIVNVVFTLIG